MSDKLKEYAVCPDCHSVALTGRPGVNAYCPKCERLVTLKAELLNKRTVELQWERRRQEKIAGARERVRLSQQRRAKMEQRAAELAMLSLETDEPITLVSPDKVSAAETLVLVRRYQKAMTAGLREATGSDPDLADIVIRIARERSDQ